MDQQRMLDEFLEYATTEASPILDVTTLTSDDVDAGRGPPGTYREPSTNKAWAMWRAAWERASTPTASNYLNVDALRERVKFLEHHSAQQYCAHRAAVERAVREAVEQEREACARIVRAFREQYEPGDDARLTLEQAEHDILARGAKS